MQRCVRTNQHISRLAIINLSGGPLKANQQQQKINKFMQCASNKKSTTTNEPSARPEKHCSQCQVETCWVNKGLAGGIGKTKYQQHRDE